MQRVTSEKKCGGKSCGKERMLRLKQLQPRVQRIRHASKTSYDSMLMNCDVEDSTESGANGGDAGIAFFIHSCVV